MSQKVLDNQITSFQLLRTGRSQKEGRKRRKEGGRDTQRKKKGGREGRTGNKERMRKKLQELFCAFRYSNILLFVLSHHVL